MSLTCVEYLLGWIGLAGVSSGDAENWVGFPKHTHIISSFPYINHDPIIKWRQSTPRYNTTQHTPHHTDSTVQQSKAFSSSCPHVSIVYLDIDLDKGLKGTG